MEDGWKEVGVPQMQDVNMNTHFNCILQGNVSQLLDILKKDDDPCRKSAGQFSVDEICQAVV